MKRIKQKIKQLSKKEKTMLVLGGVVISSLVLKNHSLKLRMKDRDSFIKGLLSDLVKVEKENNSARNEYNYLVSRILELGIMNATISQDKSKFKLEPIQEMIK